MIAGTGKVLQEPAPRQSDLGKALSDLDSYSEGKSANRDKSPGVEELVDELMQMPKEFISIKHKKSNKNTKDCMVGGSSFVVDAPGSPFVEPRKDFSKLETSLNLDLLIPEPKIKQKEGIIAHETSLNQDSILIGLTDRSTCRRVEN